MTPVGGTKDCVFPLSHTYTLITMIDVIGQSQVAAGQVSSHQISRHSSECFASARVASCLRDELRRLLSSARRFFLGASASRRSTQTNLPTGTPHSMALAEADGATRLNRIQPWDRIHLRVHLMIVAHLQQQLLRSKLNRSAIKSSQMIYGYWLSSSTDCSPIMLEPPIRIGHLLWQ